MWGVKAFKSNVLSGIFSTTVFSHRLLEIEAPERHISPQRVARNVQKVKKVEAYEWKGMTDGSKISRSKQR